MLSHGVVVLLLVESGDGGFVLLIRQLDDLPVLVQDGLAGVLAVADALVLLEQGVQLRLFDFNHFLLVLFAIHQIFVVGCHLGLVVAGHLKHLSFINLLIFVILVHFFVVVAVAVRLLLLNLHFVPSIDRLFFVVVVGCLVFLIVVLVFFVDHLLVHLLLVVDILNFRLCTLASFVGVIVRLLHQVKNILSVLREVGSGNIEFIVVGGRSQQFTLFLS